MPDNAALIQQQIEAAQQANAAYLLANQSGVPIPPGMNPATYMAMGPSAVQAQQYQQSYNSLNGINPASLANMPLSQIAAQYGPGAASQVSQYFIDNPSARFQANVDAYGQQHYNTIGGLTTISNPRYTLTPPDSAFPNTAAGIAAQVAGMGGVVNPGVARIARAEGYTGPVYNQDNLSLLKMSPLDRAIDRLSPQEQTIAKMALSNAYATSRYESLRFESSKDQIGNLPAPFRSTSPSTIQRSSNPLEIASGVYFTGSVGKFTPGRLENPIDNTIARPAPDLDASRAAIPWLAAIPLALYGAGQWINEGLGNIGTSAYDTSSKLPGPLSYYGNIVTGFGLAVAGTVPFILESPVTLAAGSALIMQNPAGAPALGAQFIRTMGESLWSREQTNPGSLPGTLIGMWAQGKVIEGTFERTPVTVGKLEVPMGKTITPTAIDDFYATKFSGSPVVKGFFDQFSKSEFSQANQYTYLRVGGEPVVGYARGAEVSPQFFTGRNGIETVIRDTNIEIGSPFGRDNPTVWTAEQRNILQPLIAKTAEDPFTMAMANIKTTLERATVNLKGKYVVEQPLGMGDQLGTTFEQRITMQQALARGNKNSVMVGSGVLDIIGDAFHRDISLSDRDISSTLMVQGEQLKVLKSGFEGSDIALRRSTLSDANVIPLSPEEARISTLPKNPTDPLMRGFSMGKPGEEHLIGFHNIEGHPEVVGMPVPNIAGSKTFVQTPENFIMTKLSRTLGSGAETKTQSFFRYDPKTGLSSIETTGAAKQVNDLIDSYAMTRYMAKTAYENKYYTLGHELEMTSDAVALRVARLSEKSIGALTPEDILQGVQREPSLQINNRPLNDEAMLLPGNRARLTEIIEPEYPIGSLSQIPEEYSFAPAFSFFQNFSPVRSTGGYPTTRTALKEPVREVYPTGAVVEPMPIQKGYPTGTLITRPEAQNYPIGRSTQNLTEGYPFGNIGNLNDDYPIGNLGERNYPAGNIKGITDRYPIGGGIDNHYPTGGGGGTNDHYPFGGSGGGGDHYPHGGGGGGGGNGGGGGGWEYHGGGGEEIITHITNNKPSDNPRDWQISKRRKHPARFLELFSFEMGTDTPIPKRFGLGGVNAKALGRQPARFLELASLEMGTDTQVPKRFGQGGVNTKAVKGNPEAKFIPGYKGYAGKMLAPEDVAPNGLFDIAGKGYRRGRKKSVWENMIS